MKLYDYQEKGVDFLVHRKHAILGDTMGLGKTVQAIEAINRIGPKTLLIICPQIAKYNWRAELKKFAENDFHKNPHIAEKIAEDITKRKVVICTYNFAEKNHEQLSKMQFDVTIIDEAQYLKNPKANRTKNILGKSGIAKNSKRLWLLSGTLATNNASELWVFLYLFGQTKLGYEDFVKQYCIVKMTDYGPKVIKGKPDKLEELRGLLSKVMLRRTKEEVNIKLPPLAYAYKNVDLEPLNERDLELYFHDLTHMQTLEQCENRVIDTLKTQREIIKSVFSNPDLALSKQQAALEAIQYSVSTYRRYLGVQKAYAFIKVLEEFLKKQWRGDKCVVFYCHNNVRDVLLNRFGESGLMCIDGQTTPMYRRNYLKDFKNPDHPARVLALNIRTAGTAINLTNARHCFFIEQDWVPANNAQAVMRLHRIGQQRKVYVNILMARDGLDMRVNNVLQQKMQELTKLFDGKDSLNLNRDFTEIRGS